MGKDRKKDILTSSEIIAETIWQTQTEVLDLKINRKSLFIGIPKETTLQERRIPLVPTSVSTLIAHGHRVIIESGAGLKSNFTDNDYSEAGAEIAFDNKSVYHSADVILKSAPPTVEELDCFSPNQLLISPLQMPVITEAYVHKLKAKRIIAMAMEYLQDDDGSYPIVRIMSEMAGISAMLTAAELLTNSKEGPGVLLGGISGVPPAKVVILGAGVVAEFATRTALGLGVQVSIFDNNIYKLMRLQSMLGRHIYTSSLNPVYLEEELVKADVAIGAIHSKTGRTPILVSEDLVIKMKPGSVIVDVSIDQGGCFETSRMTTHDNPTFIEHDVIHHCVPNIASRTSRTASIAISNIISPILVKAGSVQNIELLLYAHPGLRNGIYCYKGAITNEYLAHKFGVKYSSLDLLIMSKF